MGRHSANDEPVELTLEDDFGRGHTAVLPDAFVIRNGVVRNGVPGDTVVLPDTAMPLVPTGMVSTAPTVPMAGASIASAAVAIVPAAGAPAVSAVSDLRMLVRDRRLLALCAGVTLAIFAVYVAVLLGIHRLDDWALFLLVPTAGAGAAIGALLDRADETIDDRAPVIRKRRSVRGKPRRGVAEHAVMVANIPAHNVATRGVAEPGNPVELSGQVDSDNSVKIDNYAVLVDESQSALRRHRYRD